MWHPGNTQQTGGKHIHDMCFHGIQYNYFGFKSRPNFLTLDPAMPPAQPWPRGPGRGVCGFWMRNRHHVNNQVWEISYGKRGHPVLQGCTAYVLFAHTEKQVYRLRVRQAGAGARAGLLWAWNQGSGLHTRAATWSSAKYLPENKDLDELKLIAIPCQMCVIVNIGNGSLKNQDALFEKLQMKISLQEDVLVWNLCICCLIQTLSIKTSPCIWGVEKQLLNLIFPCIQTVDSNFFLHGQ